MNLRRVRLIAAFDLRYSILRLRGLLFLVPFFLFWILFLRRFDEGVSAWFQGDQAQIIAGTILNFELARKLLQEHPPVLSLFFVISLWSAPFFTLLAAHDPVASDAGSGFFRLLCTRCSRGELFIGRLLSQQTIITCAHVLAATACAVLSLLIDDYPALSVLVYLVQIVLILFFYTCALAALFSISSAMTSSALGALFLGMCGYWVALILVWIGNGLLSKTGMFSYLLPSGVRNELFGHGTAATWTAVFALAMYTLVYGAAAFSVFRRRNL